MVKTKFRAAAPQRAKAPGGNFAGLLALGDVSVGAVGTTTYVCGERALAFGHSLRLLGATTLSANDAEAITITTDPTARPVKLANLGATVGVLDQDRTVAIAAKLGQRLPLIRIRSIVKAPDLGRSRIGVSWTPSSELLPDVVAFHLLSNLQAVFDEEGTAVGLVTVGVTVDKVTSVVQHQLPVLFAAGGVALLLAAGGSALVSGRLRRQTRGLLPVEMTRMYEHHDAVLHAVREGVIITDGDGKLLLVNDEARRLLALPPKAGGCNFATSTKWTGGRSATGTSGSRGCSCSRPPPRA